MRTKSVKASPKKSVSKKVVKKTTKPKSTKRVIKYEDGGKKSILKSKGIKRPLRTKEEVYNVPDDYGMYEKGYKTSRINPITGRKVEKSKTTSGFKSIVNNYRPEEETRKKIITDKKGNVKEKIKSGAIKGISIEGEFNINTNKMSKENEFLKSLKALFNKEEVVELAEETPAVVEETPAEVETKVASLEVGSTVPDGTFSAEDGTVFTVTDGTISEVVMPEAPEEEKVEVDMATELSKIKEELKLSFDAQIEAIKKEFHDKEVATIELRAETKAKPNFEIKEPKTFREKIFNELINK